MNDTIPAVTNPHLRRPTDRRFTGAKVCPTPHALVQSIAVSLDGPAITADASGNANFNRILQWRGVVGVQAFDSNGGEIMLPTGFALGLIGSQTGFNYWNEAAITPVPEPAHWALLLAGLALLTQVASRRTRRS